MHESSLGGTLLDYITGQEIEETTFEEFRQALARFLVEEKGYPKENIRAKVKLRYEMDGEEFERPIDYVVYDDSDRPILLVIFCAGSVGTYERETLFAARLLDGGPVPFAVTTDTNEATLLDVASGDVVEQGMRAIPDWENLLGMAQGASSEPLTSDRREKMLRIFHTYSGFLFGTCCSESCTLPPPHPLLKKKD